MKLMSDLSARGPIRVAVIGAGLMGSGLVAQLNRINHIDVILWSSRREESLFEKARKVGVAEEAIALASTVEEAKEAYRRYGIALTVDNALSWEMDEVDVVVDCTGDTEAGAIINEHSLERGKHIVSFNVECDVLLGPYFKKKAESLGLCYTGTAGDEPGAIMELYNFATFLGFRVIAAGKGKNNLMNTEATPETLAEEAKAKGLSARMLTSFVDATNTMVELNAVANATGLLPDVAGCHGLHANIDTLAEAFKTKDEGGKIENKGILEYVMGIAPGVFVVVETDEPLIREEMPYLSMGEGPRYVFYRPYHLTNIETPITIAKAFLYGEPTISPDKGYVAHTVAVAKRDLSPGEPLSGIGSDSSYGVIVDAETCYREGYVPIGLLVGDVKVKRSISKGEPIRFEDVELDRRSELVKMFTKEHEKFYALPISPNMV
ncbi:MAG: NAD(P)-binding domain-containing protein [Peptoniphilus sp.]|nr:NAD(P)-binding domain-containing protein [Peptoniphilus sp.]MDD7362780.1 NAD(P)-binding domain-containing protein [Bacillota bacterium]MDY6044028.1 NAD(P)-binding domain-containing protein [Peptoniphilus sp.]